MSKPNYEEQVKVEVGNWTPQLINRGNGNNPTVSYDYITAKYVKLGKLVIAFFRFRGKITEVDGDNYAGISGLPYEIAESLGLGSFSSVYNLLANTDGSNLKTMPTILVEKSNKNVLNIQNGDNLGSSATNFKLSGSASFECFGGVAYITN